MPLIGGFYTTIAGTGQASLFLRAIVAGICLLPPTRADGRDAAGDRPMGGGDAVGCRRGLAISTAATSPAPSSGCLLAGFYLLRVYDMPTATYVAVALNVLVALLALAHRARHAVSPATT